MTVLRYYGNRPPGLWGHSLPGRLVILEGTDGVGRSTQIGRLKEWLETSGYAVLDTGFTRSELAGPGIQRAKLGHTLDPVTLNLFYAVDFCDRLEREVIPGLRAGMIVLADRYIFSLIARALVRGLSSEWIEGLYEFALVPDRVVYLDIDVESLLPRVVATTGFDYWESGQDFLRGPSLFSNFVEYQRRLLETYRRLAEKHSFCTIDARGSIDEVFDGVREEVEHVLRGMEAESA